MLHRTLGLAAVATSLAVPGAAQAIQFPVGSVISPGGLVLVNVSNTTPQPLVLTAKHPAVVLRSTGELVSPFVDTCPPTQVLQPGGSLLSVFAGPQTPGSYLVWFRDGGAVARLDVSPPDPTFPSSAVFPSTVGEPGIAHAFVPDGSTWTVANASSQALTITRGDLEVFAPGSTSPLASTAFDGVAVAPGGVAEFTLSAPGLPVGPYTIRATWRDSATGTLRHATHGVQDPRGGLPCDLQVPEGRTIDVGGSIALRGVVIGSPGVVSTYDYVALVGFLPGTTTLPGSTQQLPLLADSLVLDSLRTGLGGLIENGAATTVPWFDPCRATFYFTPITNGVRLHHHGVPGLGPFTVRTALVFRDLATGALHATQGEELTFR